MLARHGSPSSSGRVDRVVGRSVDTEFLAQQLRRRYRSERGPSEGLAEFAIEKRRGKLVRSSSCQRPIFVNCHCFSPPRWEILTAIAVTKLACRFLNRNSREIMYEHMYDTAVITTKIAGMIARSVNFSAVSWDASLVKTIDIRMPLITTSINSECSTYPDMV